VAAKAEAVTGMEERGAMGGTGAEEAQVGLMEAKEVGRVRGARR